MAKKPWKLFTTVMVLVVGGLVLLFAWVLVDLDNWKDHCEQLGGVTVRNGVCIDKSVVLDQR